MSAGTTEPEGHVASLAGLVALRGRVQGRRAAPVPHPSALAGGRTPGRLSRGMEYAESRAYRSGDDVRSIDWRQTARRGAPYTKLFREEHERPLHFLVDLGAGMRFGTRSAFKSVAAARAAALLAWQAVANGDRVGGIVCGSGRREVRPQSRHHGALALLRALAEGSAAAPDAGCTLGAALPALARIVQPGGLVLLVSDFGSLDEAQAGAIAALAARSEVALLHVCDAFESAPPPGLYDVTDGSRRMMLDLRSEAGRIAHLAPFAARGAMLARLARHPRMRLQTLATGDDPVDALCLLSGTP